MRLDTAATQAATTSAAWVFFFVAGLLSGLLCWPFGDTGLAWVRIEPGASLTQPPQRPRGAQRARPDRQRRRRPNAPRQRQNPRNPAMQPAAMSLHFAVPKQDQPKPPDVAPAPPAPEPRAQTSLLWIDFDRRLPRGVSYTRIVGTAGLSFALAMAVAFWLSRAADSIDQPLLIWVLFFGGIVVLFEVGNRLLFHGYFELLFRLPLWLNLGLCGALGAATMGLLTASLAGAEHSGLLLPMTLLGGVTALGAFHPIFLYPWWHTTIGTLIGLWVNPAEET